MKPPYEASAVANFFLDKAEEEGRALTMLKLIKICYVAHGWMLALADKPLINEEIEAWQYGPVIPSLYHEFKRFQKHPIVGRAKAFNFENFHTSTLKIPKDDTETKGILEKVWDVYKTVSGNSLISRTHAENTPWEKFYKKGELHVTIPNESIKEYYAKVFEEVFE